MSCGSEGTCRPIRLSGLTLRSANIRSASDTPLVSTVSAWPIARMNRSAASGLVVRPFSLALVSIARMNFCWFFCRS